MRLEVLKYRVMEHVCNIAKHICIERGCLAEGLYLAQELKDRWDEIFDSAMRKIPRKVNDRQGKKAGGKRRSGEDG
jgi:hypothetical protein